MKKIISIFCLLYVACVSLSAMTEQQKQDVITKLNQTSASIQTMSANFSQTKYLSMLSDKMVSDGKIYYSKSDKLRWEYTSPYQYLFIFNGTKVYVGNNSKQNIIDTNTNKVFKEIARIMMNTVTGTALSNNGDFETSLSMDNNQWIVTLTPKKKELKSMFTKVVLNFNKKSNIVSEINIFEKNGDRTNIKFSGIQTNKSIDATLFNIPK